MSIEKINTGWLKDYTGKKFAPKTLVTQVYNMDGSLFYSTIEQKLAKKPGYKTQNKFFILNQNGDSVQAGIGAEIFNDLRLIEDKPKDLEYWDSEGNRNYGNIAIGEYSHAEGETTTAIGKSSHSEGFRTKATEEASHAEGCATQAIGYGSHSEGMFTVAEAPSSHAEGGNSATCQIYLTGKANSLTYTYNEDPIFNYIITPNETSIDGIIIKEFNNQNKTITLEKTLSDIDISEKIYYMDLKANARGVGSHTEGRGTYTHTNLILGAQHAEGWSTFAINGAAHSEGFRSKAIGEASHAEGNETIAIGEGSHAEGGFTESHGEKSHAEGFNSYSIGDSSHAEGQSSISFGYASHSEGGYEDLSYCVTGICTCEKNSSIYTIIGGAIIDSFIPPKPYDLLYLKNSNMIIAILEIQDIQRIDDGDYKYILVGNKSASTAIEDECMILSTTTSGGDYSHAEGVKTKAVGEKSHSEGYYTMANGNNSHAEGSGTTASGINSHAEGHGNDYIDKENIKLEDYKSVKITKIGETTYSIAPTAFYYNQSIIELDYDIIPNKTFLLGYCTPEDGGNYYPVKAKIIDYDNIEKIITLDHNISFGLWDPADNLVVYITRDTEAFGKGSHAEGCCTIANGEGSHSEGISTIASGEGSHAEGYYTIANGKHSHTEGYKTIAMGDYEHVQGKFNIIDDSNNLLHTVGNGSSPTNRSNAHTIDKQGNAWFSGDVYVGSTSGINKDEGSKKLLTEDDIPDASNKMDKENPSGTGSFSLNRAKDSIIGDYSFVEGYLNQAEGNYSHAEGERTLATGKSSHAEGYLTKSYGENSHAEGYLTEAYGKNSHAEGEYTLAKSNYSHAEGGGITDINLSSQAKIYITSNYPVLSCTISEYPNSNVNLEEDIIPGQTFIGYDKSWHKIKTYRNNVITFYDSFPKDYPNLVNEPVSVGFGVRALGLYSHAEGQSTLAEGNSSHAEGYLTEATEFCTHAEGHHTRATGECSHAEGRYSFATANYSHVEGYNTIAHGIYSHAEGKQTHSDGEGSHAEGIETNASGRGAHAEGVETEANTSGSHAEGINTFAHGYCSHAEGENTNAFGPCSHVEGRGDNSLIYTEIKFATHQERYKFILTSGPLEESPIGKLLYDKVHLFGFYVIDYDEKSLILTVNEGHWYSQPHSADGLLITLNSSGAIGQCSHAEGDHTFAGNLYSHSEGYRTKAIGMSSHAEGDNTIATGDDSHAEGSDTIAKGTFSHAEGYSTIAEYNQHVQGHYNKVYSGSSSVNGSAFIIGNGYDENSRSNAFRVTYGGATYAKAAYNSSGADYAEFFEWKDNNLNNEDRRGYFVTLDNDKIKIATPKDYILGVVSGQPSIIGNSDEEWMGRYILDDFGCFIIEEFEYQDEIYNTKEEKEIIIRKGFRYKENPNYDPTQTYIQRQDRPEWSAVGMLGMLSVRDDGTCKVNGYCTVNENGVATASNNGYRVIKRINDNVVKIIFK